MNLEEFRQKFHPLPPHEKIKFIYTQIDLLSGEERVQFLLSVVRDEKSSPLVKATALKFLRQAAYQDIDIYEKYATDSFQATSRAAQKALKEFGDTERKARYYAESVVRKLDSLQDRGKRLKILKAISKLQTSWVLNVLLHALSDPCEKNRDFLIEELTQRDIWQMSLLYAKLVKQPWYVKSAILKILGKRKDRQAIACIERVLTDPNVDVRQCAAEALGNIGGKEVLGLLVKLSKDKSSYVRSAANEAIRKASQVRFSG